MLLIIVNQALLAVIAAISICSVGSVKAASQAIVPTLSWLQQQLWFNQNRRCSDNQIAAVPPRGSAPSTALLSSSLRCIYSVCAVEATKVDSTTTAIEIPSWRVDVDHTSVYRCVVAPSIAARGVLSTSTIFYRIVSTYCGRWIAMASIRTTTTTATIIHRAGSAFSTSNCTPKAADSSISAIPP
ncbi:hypothetical protein IMCC20628_04529 [Hoeflea sp. IMCC20628]|nr:hypothetical protein IMCC20628_04529 [Hoeflea sp. IMCC20628]